MSRTGVARALAAEGIKGPFSIQPLPGGANNRVFRVETDQGPLLGKVYFRHRGDVRDRLGAEMAFLNFAWSCGIRCIPRPVAADRDSGTALMEFVPGRKLGPGEATRDRVAEAAAFFTALNRHRGTAAARTLPEGSEACFSLDEHLRCVDRRLGRLSSVRGRSPASRDAARFVRSELTPAWCATERSVRSAGTRASSARLAARDRCLSPSDFGFHNALLRADGTLCFIDFEYAGWDDPSKTACDFFCQPAVPVDPRDRASFVRSLVGGLDRPEAHAERIRLLFPVYQLKWCCILLNEFLPVGGARRKFAAIDCDPEERKADQLKKARAALARVGSDVVRA